MIGSRSRCTEKYAFQKVCDAQNKLAFFEQVNVSREISVWRGSAGPPGRVRAFVPEMRSLKVTGGGMAWQGGSGQAGRGDPVRRGIIRENPSKRSADKS